MQYKYWFTDYCPLLHFWMPRSVTWKSFTVFLHRCELAIAISKDSLQFGLFKLVLQKVSSPGKVAPALLGHGALSAHSTFRADETLLSCSATFFCWNSSVYIFTCSPTSEHSSRLHTCRSRSTLSGIQSSWDVKLQFWSVISSYFFHRQHTDWEKDVKSYIWWWHPIINLLLSSCNFFTSKEI